VDLSRRVGDVMKENPDIPLKALAKRLNTNTATISYYYHAARRVM
jgi:predicted transcriptional regulator